MNIYKVVASSRSGTLNNDSKMVYPVISSREWIDRKDAVTDAISTQLLNLNINVTVTENGTEIPRGTWTDIVGLKFLNHTILKKEL